MNRFLLGADPELFVVNAKGEFISSIGKFGGTKDNPKPIGAGCAIQEDNVAVEFNIPPSADADSFIAGLNYALAEIEAKAMEHGLKLAIVPSAVFSPDQLQDPAAKRFGCDPDYNAWTGRPNPRPRAKDKALRSSGGHVHFGWLEGAQHDTTIMVRACDVFIGAPLAQADQDQRRRLLYGKAGAYRDKPQYPGFEYRTPSNWWIATPARMDWMFHTMQDVVDYVDEFPGYDFQDVAPLVDAAINGSGNAQMEAFHALNARFELEIPA